MKTKLVILLDTGMRNPMVFERIPVNVDDTKLS